MKESASEPALIGLMEAALLVRMLERDHERRPAESRAEVLAKLGAVLREAYEASTGLAMFPAEPTEEELAAFEFEEAGITPSAASERQRPVPLRVTAGGVLECVYCRAKLPSVPLSRICPGCGGGILAPPSGGSGDRDEALEGLVEEHFRRWAVDIMVEDFDAAVIAGMASAQKFHLSQAEALERVMRYAAEERRQALDAILAHGQMSWPMEDE